MKKLTTTLIISTALISGFAGYTLFKPNQPESSTNHSHFVDNDTVLVGASWGEEHPSINSLISSSDLIVIGRLNQQFDSYQPFDDYPDTFTDAEIVIEKVLKGNEENSLIVSQYGGIRQDGKNEVFEFLPLLEKGKNYLMFLEKIEDDTARNGKYQYVGGIQGFYFLDAPKSSLKKLNENKLNEINGQVSISSEFNAGITKKVSDSGIVAIIKEIESTEVIIKEKESAE